MSTWSLVVDLKSYINTHKAEGNTNFAEMALEAYTFPAIMLLALPNGTIVHSTNANEFLEIEDSVLATGFQDPASYHYLQFLEKGLEKAQPYLSES